jgi:MtN3 and saliva related transmembrane protein
MAWIHPEIIGYVGATLTTAAFIPQAWKVLKTRETHSISLAMYVLFTLGVLLWLLYGVAIESWPVICANAITLLLASLILSVKLKEK